MVRLISWNMARRGAAWSGLKGLRADLALLQEAGRPDQQWADAVSGGVGDVWETVLLGGRGPWRTAVVAFSDRVQLRPRATLALEAATSADDWVVSRAGSITAPDVVTDEGVMFAAVSVYAAWETAPSRGYADGSEHRILSDLSGLLGRRDPRLVVAGDWTILRGYGEHGDAYWKARYDTGFDRAAALGLLFVGPELPNGRQADPWPQELPRESRCVPTLHHRGQTPETATRQLDFVFASTSLPDRIKMRAMNEPAEWGLSDHCRVLIDLEP